MNGDGVERRAVTGGFLNNEGIASCGSKVVHVFGQPKLKAMHEDVDSFRLHQASYVTNTQFSPIQILKS